MQVYDKWQDHEGKERIEFSSEAALHYLLENEIVFLNSNWWFSEWPEEAQKTFAICVNCNDIFAWGCADAEELMYSELEDLYKHAEKDPVWGGAVWCIKKRKEMPQEPARKYIEEAGIWDLNKIAEEHDLKVNGYDTVMGVYAETQYQKYSVWCVANLKKPLPFDKNWWKGWDEYVKDHPNFREEQWYKDISITIVQKRAMLYKDVKNV